MAVLSRAVTVGTTATRLDSDEGGQASQAFSMKNIGSATVYLGGPDVTTANGAPLAAGEWFAADLAKYDVMYGIVATGTQACRVIEVSV